MEQPAAATRPRMPKVPRIPPMTVRRLSTYYRLLRQLEAKGETEPLSSERISQLTGFTAAQVRRDLAYFGSFGKRGVGYDIAELQQSLRSILGLDHPWHIALIGVGNLGTALMAYPGFARQGFHIVAAFDVDATKHGRRIGTVVVRPMEDLPEVVREQGILMAIMTVPASAAQQVADAAVKAGIKGILNFAPVQLHVPKDVYVSSVDLSIEIEYLSYLLTNA
jgi:redox-sensing transcriptional repressor